MTYLIKTINGDQYQVDQKTRDAISKALLVKERPAFIEIKSQGAIIATSSITSIIIHKQDVVRLPTPEEELAEFNRTWKAPEERAAQEG